MNLPKIYYVSAGVLVATLLIIFLIVPIVKSWAGEGEGYQAATKKCGTQPIIANDIGSAYTYTVPGQSGYHKNQYGSRYFCSEEEAQKAGYHKSL